VARTGAKKTDLPLVAPISKTEVFLTGTKKQRATAAVFATICIEWVGSSLITGCSRDRAGNVSRANAAPAAAYPRAMWRLSSMSQLNRTVQWVSHILITHRNSAYSPFLRPMHWTPDGPPSRRSPQDAQILARQIAMGAQSQPENFAALAKQYSEDPTSRNHGGSLGGMLGGQLPPQFLDALSVLRPGQVSDVLETSMGFHVLLKRGPPPPIEATGLAIVIRYATTIGRFSSNRVHGDAEQIAASLVARARAGEDFSKLCETYSEDLDSFRRGRMGTWSSREPGGNSISIEVLTGLLPGQVSDPIDTRFGFQVIKRIDDDSRRPEFAMRQVRIDYNSAVPESELRARADAEQIAAELAIDPKKFDSFRAEHCCSDVDRWADGHGSAVLTAVLESLSFGAIAEHPIPTWGSYVIPQRLDPALLDVQEPISFDLPSPMSVDVETAVAIGSPKQLVAELKNVRNLFGSLRLKPKEQVSVGQALDAFQSEIAAAGTESERRVAYRKALLLMYTSLSEASYGRVTDAIQRWLAARTLTTASD
jgi:hypothetical protein